jgi:GNAT superfamily N-acetyltransferase
MTVHIRQPADERECEASYDLRWRVLREPWNQPRGSERDQLDGTDCVWDVVAVDDGRIVGSSRLHLNTQDEAQLRFLAVEEDQRGGGIGKRIVESIEDEARRRGAKWIVANVREDAIPFYQKLGWRATGPGPRLFDSIHHVRMSKRL